MYKKVLLARLGQHQAAADVNENQVAADANENQAAVNESQTAVNENQAAVNECQTAVNEVQAAAIDFRAADVQTGVVVSNGDRDEIQVMNALLLLCDQYGDSSQLDIFSSQNAWNDDSEFDNYLNNNPNLSQVNESQWFHEIEPLLTFDNFRVVENNYPIVSSHPNILSFSPIPIPSPPSLILPSQPSPLSHASPQFSSCSSLPSTSPQPSQSLFFSTHTSESSSTKSRCMRQKKKERLSLKFYKKKTIPNPVPAWLDESSPPSSWLVKPISLSSSPSPSPPYGQYIFTPSSPLYSEDGYVSPNSITNNNNSATQASVILIPDTQSDCDEIQMIEPVEEHQPTMQLVEPQPIVEHQSVPVPVVEPDPIRIRLDGIHAMIEYQIENFQRILSYLEEEEKECLKLLGV